MTTTKDDYEDLEDIRVLTALDASKLTDEFTYRQILGFLKAGVLPHEHRSNTYFILREDFDAFMERVEAQGESS